MQVEGQHELSLLSLMAVEGQHELSLLSLMATGARVSNAYPTCRGPRDSPLKGGLTPDALAPPPGGGRKG